MNDEEVLTADEVAIKLGVSVKTVYRYLQSGQLSGWRLGRKSGWKVKATDLDAFIDAHKTPTQVKLVEGEDGKTYITFTLDVSKFGTKLVHQHDGEVSEKKKDESTT